MNKNISSLDKLEYLVYILLLMTPFFDTLNGMLIFYKINFSIAILLKGLIIILTLLYLLMKKNLTIVFISIGFILLLGIKNFMQEDNLSIELIWVIKIYFFMILFLFMKETINGNYKMVHIYFKILLFSIIFNILGGFLFGYGFVAYEGTDLGSKGFYYAGNELGGVFISLSAYVAIILIHKKSTFKYILGFVFLLFLSLLTTMKSSILGTLLVFMAVPFIYAYTNMNNFIMPRWIFYMIGFFIIILSILLPISFYYVYYVLGLETRLGYALNNASLLSAILSHRDVWAVQMMQYFSENSSYYTVLFGYAYEIAFRLFGNRSEIDIVDILFSYGLLGVILIYGFWLNILYRFIFLKTKLTGYILYAAILIFLVSFMSGHILNSGIGAVPFAILFSLAYLTIAEEEEL